MTKRQETRARKWADALRKVKTGFDMGHWFDTLSDIESGVTEMKQILKEEVHTCGTSACAAGYLPAIFPRSFSINNVSRPVLSKWANHRGFKPGDPEWNQRWDPNVSIAEFFGISVRDADRITDPYEYDCPDHVETFEVAARIEMIIKEYRG